MTTLLFILAKDMDGGEVVIKRIDVQHACLQAAACTTWQFDLILLLPRWIVVKSHIHYI